MAQISASDERELIWFFSEAQATGISSTTGVMLEKQAALAQHIAKCRSCQGTGFAGGDAAKTIKSALEKVLAHGDAATKFRARQQIARLDRTCRRCSGSGVVLAPSVSRVRESSLLAGTAKCRQCRGLCGQIDCQLCGGAGYESSNNVGMIHVSQQEVPEMPSVRGQERFARISSRLYRVGSTVARTLAAYYGDSGALWERTKGRLCAVYSLTNMGKALIAHETNASEGPDRILRELLELDALQPTSERGKRLQTVAVEAGCLYGRAVDVWEQTNGQYARLECE